MLPKSQEKKPPASSIRPFPWRCHTCFKDAVYLSRVAQYEATLKHDGQLYTFVIPEIEIPVCTACGERIFTEKVDDQIRDAFRRQHHFLTPLEMREAIRRIGVPQKEVAENLGIAEETLSRWINEYQIQSRAMDTLLRIYFGFPLVREALSSEQGRAALGLMGLPVSVLHG